MKTFAEFVAFLDANPALKNYSIDTDDYHAWIDAVEDNSEEFAIGTTCDQVRKRLTTLAELFGAAEIQQDIEESFDER